MRPRSFLRAESGLAATEFALILPILLMLYLSLIEFSQGFAAARKTNQLSQLLSDLTAENTTVNSTDIETIFAVGKETLHPFDNNVLAMRISAIRIDGLGRAYVDWSEAKSTGAGLPALARCTEVTDLPASMLIPRTSFIRSEANLLYTPAIGTLFITQGINFNEIAYAVPIKQRVHHSGFSADACTNFVN